MRSLITLLSLLLLAAACGGNDVVDHEVTDPCSGVERVCTSNSDCSEGVCTACGACKTDTSCTRTSDCGLDQLCRNGTCEQGECGTSEDCDAGKRCNQTTKTCEVYDCTRDGCEGGQRCRTEDKLCVDCLGNHHCDDSRAPWCELDSGECVQCRGDGDCEDDETPVCNMATLLCVQCTGDEHCTTPGQDRCKADAGICGECATDEDCPGSVCRDDATCDPGAEDGEACPGNGICAPGFVCNEYEDVCRPACNPYEQACDGDRICTPLVRDGRVVFDDGRPQGVCIDDPGGIRVGAECGGDESYCTADAFCLFDNPESGYCRGFCDPAAPTCPTGQSCIGVPLGTQGEDVGVCSPPTTIFADCAADGECGTGQSCQVSTDGQGGLTTRCAWNEGEKAGLAACTDGAQCASGVCVNDGAGTPGFCYQACADDASCSAGGWCGEIDWNLGGGSTATTSGCFPGCGSTTDCSQYPNNVCNLIVDEDRLVPTCMDRRGTGAAGAQCTTDNSCGTGLCFDNATATNVADDGICLGPCLVDADCASGTQCRPVELTINAAGDSAVANICWGASCGSDADCDHDRACVAWADPNGGAYTGCSPAYGDSLGGEFCMSNDECRSGFCSQYVCHGVCTVDADCATGSMCWDTGEGYGICY